MVICWSSAKKDLSIPAFGAQLALLYFPSLGNVLSVLQVCIFWCLKASFYKSATVNKCISSTTVPETEVLRDVV